MTTNNRSPESAVINGSPSVGETITITIPERSIERALLHIVGDSPLIVHKWSEKAKAAMRNKQLGKAQNKKEPKVPQSEYEAAFHRLDNGRPGFPSIGFKAAAVSAARQVEGLKMTLLRGAFHVDGELIEIEGEPRMREDMVRVGMGTADIRYRPEFPEWSAILPIRYNPNAITLEQLTHLFNQAGFSVGVGEWRPEKDGQYGMFHVEGVEPL